MINVILVAAGRGKRMQSEIPKQFITINGIQIIEHCLCAFINSSIEANYFIVLHKDYFHFGEEIIARYPNEKIALVEGGEDRYNSVKNAIHKIKNEQDIVLIHDAVRPFVSKEIILNAIKHCKINGNAIPVIPVKDSLRKIASNGFSIAVPRKDFFAVQTPQAFKFNLIKALYQKDFNPTITDDASLLEEANEKIFLFDGDERNFKITHPIDLEIAKYLMQ